MRGAQQGGGGVVSAVSLPTLADADKLVDKACYATSMLLEAARILDGAGIGPDSGLPISDTMRNACRAINAFTEQAYLLLDAVRIREEACEKCNGSGLRGYSQCSRCGDLP
jgi:hypothetical protein